MLHQSAWWIKRRRSLFDNDLKKDVVVLQVTILVLLTSGAAAISWLIRAKLDGANSDESTNLLAILLMAIAFVGIAIASWTSLLQVTAIVEARDEAEHLFKVALDTVLDAVLLLDENGIVRKANKLKLAIEDLQRTQAQLIQTEKMSSLGQIVVDKHQGKIECISQPGLGAEFCIEIPIRQIK